MKAKLTRYLIFTLLALTVSCGEPETIVTDIVHRDGTVTRLLEMRNSKNDFGISKIQVPFDSTWICRDSLEINEKGDTTWVRRAEKLYSGIDEINRAYAADSGANKKAKRRADLVKKFRWFYTGYRYSETIDKSLISGYPVSDFLNNDELLWFYNDGNIAVLKKDSFKPYYVNGILDSAKYNEADSIIKAKTDEWSLRSLISDWSSTFSELAGPDSPKALSYDSLHKKEDLMYEIISKDEDDFDNLWEDGIILKEMIGEANAIKYRTEADSAINLSVDRFLMDFSGYELKMKLPGTPVGGNGYLDSTGCQVWKVKSDFFLTEPYEMYAESKVINWWAWIVSGVFVMFVISGMVFRKMKKG